MKRTSKQHNSRPTGGAGSNTWKVWNEYHPDDPIIPGDGCVIHHEDENPWNDSPNNLQKMTDVQHKKHHTSNGRHPNQGRKFSPELRKKLSETHKGQKAWNKGIPMSEEQKKKISAAKKGQPSPCGMLGKRHSEETKRKMRESHAANK